MLRLLAAEGMVSLGTLSLDGAKLAGNAAQKLNRTLPQIEEILAEAAVADVAGPGSSAESATRRAWPAVTRSEPGRKAGTRPQQPGNGAGAAPAPNRRAPTGRRRAAGEHHRPGTCG